MTCEGSESSILVFNLTTGWPLYHRGQTLRYNWVGPELVWTLWNGEPASKRNAIRRSSSLFPDRHIYCPSINVRVKRILRAQLAAV